MILSAGDGDLSRRLTLYTSQAAEQTSLQRARAALAGPHRTVEDNTSLANGGFNAADIARAGRAAGAAALALAACREKAFYVDFANLHSTARRHLPRVRLWRWVAIVGGAAAILLIAAVVGWQKDLRDIAAYRQQLAEMSEDIAAARQVVDRMSYASAWTVRRPRFLDCLHELTGAFPEEGSVWVVSLALRENKQGLITGQARRESDVLGVLDALKANSAFADVAMVYMRDAGRETNEVSFAITFKYLAMD